jgi:hypothetical protein
MTYPTRVELESLRPRVVRRAQFRSLAFALVGLAFAIRSSLGGSPLIVLSGTVIVLVISLGLMMMLARNHRSGVREDEIRTVVDSTLTLSNGGRLRKAVFPATIVLACFALSRATMQTPLGVFSSVILGTSFATAIKVSTFPRLFGSWQNDLSAAYLWASERASTR